MARRFNDKGQLASTDLAPYHNRSRRNRSAERDSEIIFAPAAIGFGAGMAIAPRWVPARTHSLSPQSKAMTSSPACASQPAPIGCQPRRITIWLLL